MCFAYGSVHLPDSPSCPTPPLPACISCSLFSPYWPLDFSSSLLVSPCLPTCLLLLWCLPACLSAPPWLAGSLFLSLVVCLLLWLFAHHSLSSHLSPRLPVSITFLVSVSWFVYLPGPTMVPCLGLPLALLLVLLLYTCLVHAISLPPFMSVFLLVYPTCLLLSHHLMLLSFHCVCFSAFSP